jgi:hypothetical protein
VARGSLTLTDSPLRSPSLPPPPPLSLARSLARLLSLSLSPSLPVSLQRAFSPACEKSVRQRLLTYVGLVASFSLSLGINYIRTSARSNGHLGVTSRRRYKACPPARGCKPPCKPPVIYAGNSTARDRARIIFGRDRERSGEITERGERGTRSRVGALITADSRRGLDGAIGERNRLIMPRQAAICRCSGSSPVDRIVVLIAASFGRGSRIWRISDAVGFFIYDSSAGMRRYS